MNVTNTASKLNISSKSFSYTAGRRRHLGQGRPTGKLRSNLWHEVPDESLYDSKSIDDWGVNRDMQQSYKAPQEKEFEACKASAAGSLAYRPHSRSELTTKLLDKGFDKATIERALNRLQELGLQSDVEFVTIFARSKWRQSRWAPSRIRIELVRKGVSPEDIEHGLREVFGTDAHKLHVHTEDAESNDATDSSKRLDLQLLESAHRQAHLTRGMPSETRRRRMVAWLQRRGHSWDTISSLLRELAL
ncbi:g3681 [Coccomyxa elongata]